MAPVIDWIDNHCHLGEDAAEAIAAANQAGVRKLIDVGCDLVTSQACVEHAAAFEQVYATVGLHPHEAQHGIGGLEALLDNPKVIAVGECGLDYHYDYSPRDAQHSMFAAQIELAHRHELPLVIHTREAWEETFEILDAEGFQHTRSFIALLAGLPRPPSVFTERHGSRSAASCRSSRLPMCSRQQFCVRSISYSLRPIRPTSPRCHTAESQISQHG